MRFGLGDDSSEEEEEIYQEAYSYSSDEFENLTRERTRPSIPRTQLGRSIKAAFDSSDESVNSEDEVDDLSVFNSSLPSGKRDIWREKEAPKKTRKQTPKKVAISGKIIPKLDQPGPSNWARQTGEPSLRQVLDEGPTEYEGWLKETEEEAWRDGQKLSQTRRGQLREIKMNARIELQNERARKSAKETEEIQRLLKGLIMRQEDDEKRRRSEFAERERKLWADIDAAIAETNRKAEQALAASIAAEKKRKEEEGARIAQAEKLAQAKRVEAEKASKERSEKEQAEKDAHAASERAKAAKLEEEAAKAKEKELGNLTRTEWGKWVDKQRWMKKEVIEVVKSDKALRAGLKVGMRLMTRGLGQVVNTRESVLRVTDDINNILNSQLPSIPSPSNPTLLSQPPPVAYTYLLSHVSKALIKQAESEVNAKADAAFPLARIVVGLLLRGHAALGEVLFARFVKKAPWVVPFYPGRMQNQSREEYEKSTGRGSDESVSDYISRQAGIVTLYFAILQTPLSSLVTTQISKEHLSILIPPPLRLPQAWTWISNILKDPLPALSPTAHLLSVWIEILGHEVSSVYGRGQVTKIIEVIGREGLSGGDDCLIKGDSEAARQRLRLAVEAWGREGGKVHSAREWS